MKKTLYDFYIRIVPILLFVIILINTYRITTQEQENREQAEHIQTLHHEIQQNRNTIAHIEAELEQTRKLLKQR